MADEYINKESFARTLEDRMDSMEGSSLIGGLLLARILLDATGADDVLPVVHGEWVSSHGISQCSICGKSAPYDVEADIITYWPNLNFCPNCGADMRGTGNGTKM